MKRAAALAAAGALTLALTGCGERSEPVGVDVSPYPVTVRGSDGREVTLTTSPARIVALTRGTAAVLADVGAGHLLVGSQAVWDAPARQLPRLVAGLRPDLVVAPSTAPQRLRDGISKATATPIYVMPDRTLQDLESALTGLGLLTNRSVAARALIHGDETARLALARRLQGRPAVRVFVDTSFLSTTVSTRSLFSDLLRIAGGRNVAGADPEPGLFSIARLKKLDPQVYLMTTNNKAAAFLRARRKARTISAVRNRRFYRIPPAYLKSRGRLGPRLLQLAALLHPDARS